MEEMLKLLRERIMQCLKKYYFSLSDMKKNDDMRQFSINVAADLFVEMLEDNPDLKDKIINNFKQ